MMPKTPSTVSHPEPTFSEQFPDIDIEDVDETRRQIDEKLVALNKTAHTLKARRNALAPISRLSTELLCRIFTITALRARSSFVAPPKSKLDWIVVSHVCARWRSVALGYSNLWTELALWNPRWMEEMMKRSNNASLTLSANLILHPPEASEGLMSALDQIHRVRSINIFMPSSALRRALVGMNRPAPLLESLRLGNAGDMQSNIICTLPQMLFNGVTPRLRHLHLVGCSVQWDTQLISGLTYLGIFGMPRPRPTIAQLLEVLKANPMLEELQLDDSLPSHLQDTSYFLDTNDLLTLPYLTSVELGGNILDCASLLKCILVPPTASLSLRCENCLDISSIMPVVGAHAAGPKSLRSILITYVVRYKTNTLISHIRFQGWTQISHQNLSDPLIDIRLEKDDDTGGDLTEMMLALCRPLALSEVVKLQIGVQKDTGLENIWVDAFSAAGSQTFRIVGNPPVSLLLGMLGESKVQEKPRRTTRRSTIQGAVDSLSGPIVLSDLQLITCDASDLISSDPTGKTIFDGLVQLLKRRKMGPATLKELRIHNCLHVTDKMVIELGKLGPDVTCNGFGLVDEEEEDDEDDNDDDDDDDDPGPVCPVQ